MGASVEAGGIAFCVWAPNAREVSVLFPAPKAHTLALEADEKGFFSGFAAGVTPGTAYQYQLDGSEPLPDPYSRFQPDGPHGPSMAIDPGHYRWTDSAWAGLDPLRQVIYEMHVGTFTPEGTYEAAIAQLPILKQLGITAVELMPVAEFAGERGWGYDGVDFFAPYHRYGTPDELRRFVDSAHTVGLGVILDVVYNHIGEDGNYLERFASEYFTDQHATDWGKTFNYSSEPVRQFAIDNAAYWIGEFHMDGLRLDATQGIHDPEHPSLLAAMVKAARAAAGTRTIVISGEDHLQRSHLLLDEPSGGANLDQLWNDDFHHVSRVAATGNRGGYFCNYRGHAQELLSAVRGFLFQGQYDDWSECARGEPVTPDTEPSAFVAFTQNHDQVANTLFGQRLHQIISPGRSRALNALLLLGPHTPLIFMGQEFDATQPFPYFADTAGPGAKQLWDNRRKETADFEQYAGAAARAQILDPLSLDTFRRTVLDFAERERNAPTCRLFEDLLALRRDDEVLSRRPADCIGAVLGERALALRWRDDRRIDRLLIVNLGDAIERPAIAEPVLAAPQGRSWRLHWCSDEPEYGGLGIVAPIADRRVHFAADCACLLVAE
jgi:maltooligosyltrehalose trehalohydrolase